MRPLLIELPEVSAGAQAPAPAARGAPGRNALKMRVFYCSLPPARHTPPLAGGSAGGVLLGAIPLPPPKAATTEYSRSPRIGCFYTSSTGQEMQKTPGKPRFLASRIAIRHRPAFENRRGLNPTPPAGPGAARPAGWFRGRTPVRHEDVTSSPAVSHAPRRRIPSSVDTSG